jgi:cell pole-organizing protein PopZ
MEEILASIRRIISEDDKPAEEVVPEKAPEALAPPPAEVVAPPAPSAHEPVHAPEAEEDEEVLELTEPAHETHGDLEVFTPRVETPRPPPAPEPAPPPRLVEPEPEPYDDALLSVGVEDEVLSHFGRLSQTIAMPKSQRTLEDVVRELLRPLLTDWLDEHLPRIVEEKVQAEVERIARRRP